MNKFMRLFALLLVVVAIVLVVLSFKFGHDKTRQREAAATPAPAVPVKTHHTTPQTRAAVVAATDLVPGKAISADQLKLAKVAKDELRTGYFRNINEVVGKVPAVPIAGQQMLTKNLLLDDLSMKLLSGQRAISVPVSEVSSAGNHIHAGDFVDVFFTLQHPLTPHSHEQQTQSRLLLSRVRVLAYGTRDLPKPTPPQPATKDKKKAAKDQPVQRFSAHTATLAVPVALVNKLLLASRHGKLALALRNPLDPAQPTTTIFPQPSPVLVARTPRHTPSDPTAADDPALPATAPINQAYAGISLGGVAHGSDNHVRRTTFRRRPAYHRIEVIRGTQRGHITERNGEIAR